MAMIYLAIATWIIFVIASAVSLQWFKRRSLERLNRHYVNVVDDTFKSLQMTLGTMEKNQAARTKLVLDLTDAILTLDKMDKPIASTVSMSDANALVSPKPSTGKFIMDLEYTRDKFAETSVEKNVMNKLITRIKNRHG
jgi:hypothetical protein